MAWNDMRPQTADSFMAQERLRDRRERPLRRPDLPRRIRLAWINQNRRHPRLPEKYCLARHAEARATHRPIIPVFNCSIEQSASYRNFEVGNERFEAASRTWFAQILGNVTQPRVGTS